MRALLPPDAPLAVPPACLVLRSQEQADRLLEALWRARVERNVMFKRARWWSRHFARVPE